MSDSLDALFQRGRRTVGRPLNSGATAPPDDAIATEPPASTAEQPVPPAALPASPASPAPRRSRSGRPAPRSPVSGRDDHPKTHPDEPVNNLMIRVRRSLDDRLGDLVYKLRKDGVKSSKVELVEMLLWELPPGSEAGLRQRLAEFRRRAPRSGDEL